MSSESSPSSNEEDHEDHSSIQKKRKKNQKRTVWLFKKPHNAKLFLKTERPGPVGVAKNAFTESQAFSLLITDEMITFIVDYMNTTM